MEAFSDYSQTSLWNSDDLTAGTGAGEGHELQSAALSSLIEDKEIAARAVAIVIGSARRGVVSLCADVAELLKAKSSLERQVGRLASENRALRTSSSASSQPDVDLDARCASANTSGYHSRPAVACSVEVHRAPPPAPARPASDPGVSPARPRRRHQSVQWPLVSAGVEDELASLREEVRAALRANAAIVSELMQTKEELSRLRGNQTEDLAAAGPCPLCRGDPGSLSVGPASSVPPSRSPTAPAAGAVSLLGCACRHCFLLRRQGCPRRLLQPTTGRSNHAVRIKDAVVTADGRRGCVKYMGHVDGDADRDAIWLGLEFDEPVGSGDGKLDSKRYFSCRPDHGDFVRLEDIDTVCPRSSSPTNLTPAGVAQESDEGPASAALYVTDFI